MFYLQQEVALFASFASSITSFAIAIEAPVGIASASFSHAVSISTGIVKVLLKTRQNKKKHNESVVLARNKLDSIESKISEAVINDEISHLDFMIITNEEAKRSDSEKINLIEGGKNIGIDKVVKRCEFINSNYFIINI